MSERESLIADGPAMEWASNDDGVIWLPRSEYTRAQARTFFSDHVGAAWIDVRVLARWMVWTPDDPCAEEYDGLYWTECKKDVPGAFQVWRCE